MIEWQTLYEEMLTSIERCRQLPLSEIEQIEVSFNKIPLDHWGKLKKKLALHQFVNANEEIDFYKNIKPKFTCFLEYLPIIYLALSFLPANDSELQKYFWIEESGKLQKFVEKNMDFVNYYRNGSCNYDNQYFLPANYDLACFTVSKIYDMDGEFMTSHDHLVANLFAQEMYYEYVKNKLEMF